MSKLTDPDQLNVGTEITINTTAKTFTLVEAGNLVAKDGVTLQAIYSKFVNLWTTESYNKYPFPIYPTDALSGQYIFGFDGNRLYFREAEKGWSIVKAPVGYTSKLRITDKSLRDAFKQFDGSYKFKYDKDNGLYYIEKISA